MSKLLYSMNNEIYSMSHVVTLLDMQYYLQQAHQQGVRVHQLWDWLPLSCQTLLAR